MKPIYIEIPGPPVAKARARTVRGKNGSVHSYTPKKTREWEDTARAIARIVMRHREIITGPIKLGVIFRMEIPERWPKWKKAGALSGWIEHTGKPDKNNLTKAVEDALNGVVWVDDSQVIFSEEYKTYGEFPRVEIWATKYGHFSAATVKKADLE